MGLLSWLSLTIEGLCSFVSASLLIFSISSVKFFFTKLT